MGYIIGLLATVTVAVVFRKAMPALLFILPLELIGISLAAFLKYGKAGLQMLISFDEELALKSGQQQQAMLATGKQ